MSIDERLGAAAEDLRVALRDRDGTAWPDTEQLRTRALRHRRRQGLLTGVGVILVAIVVAGTALAVHTDHQRVTTNVPTAAADPAVAIRTAIAVLFEPGHSAPEKLAQVEDSHDLSYVITKGMTDPRAPSLTAMVTSVEIDGNTATAHIDFFIQGGLAMKDAQLVMVFVGDRWVAQHASYCALVSTSGPRCPDPDRLSPGGPTQQAIVDTMARTVLATDHSRHFAPDAADSPVAVTDGGSGTLTVARGFVTGSNDPTQGQLVFVWHDDQFIGWTTSEMVLGSALQPKDPSSIEATYVYIEPGEGACCATGQDAVVYHWDGTKLVADRDPLPQDFFGAVELLPG